MQAERQLVGAITSENIRLIEQLITQINDINIPVGDTTFLHLAVEKGNFNIVRLLLNSGCSVHLRNKNGLTPLLSAIENNHFEIYKLLKENGSNLEQTDVSGASALHYAVQSGNIEFVKSLLESGVNIAPLAKFDSTPLHIGVRGTNTALLKLLIERGAPLECITTQSYTPLHIACMKGNIEVVKVLTEGNANIEARTNKRYTPLHLAALAGHQVVVEYLISVGADANVIDSEANKPSALARSKNFEKVAEILERAEKMRFKGPKRAVNVVAIYPYTKELFGEKTRATDIFFKPNDIIKCDDITSSDGWWEGELNGRKGTFPSTYVSSTILCKVIVTHNYYASRTDEINIKKGEEIEVFEKKPNNWWRGIAGDKCGLFPSTHVADIKFKKAGASLSASNVPSYPTSIPTFPSSSPSTIPSFPTSFPSAIPSFPTSYQPTISSFNSFPNTIPSLNPTNDTNTSSSPLMPKLQKPTSKPKPVVGSPVLNPIEIKKSPIVLKKVSTVPEPVQQPITPIPIAIPTPASPPPTTPSRPKAHVLYAYEAQHPGDLALTVGTIIEITKMEGGWWEGIYENQEGIFPANYVELLP